jgi:hypothetical protein
VGAFSQNGWPASPNAAAIGVYTYTLNLGGKTFKVGLQEAAAPAFLSLIKWFHENIEPIKLLGGFNYREIRGQEGTGSVSNHGSGTAIDINWDDHPLAAVHTFTTAQEEAIRKKSSELGLRWGGDYRNRKDEMHFEVANGPAVFAALRIRPDDDIDVITTAGKIIKVVDWGGIALTGSVGAAMAVVGGVGMVKVAKVKGYEVDKKVMLVSVGSGLLLGGFAALLTWGIRHR